MIPKSGNMRVGLVWLVCALGVAPACTPLAGAPGRPGGVYGRATEFYGEIRGVDTRRDRIYVDVGRGGTRAVHYDRRTRVYAGRRSYPVSALRRGDDVRMRVVFDRRGVAWADWVEIRDRDRWEWRRWDGRWDDRRDHRRGGDDRWDDDDGRSVAWRVERWSGRIRAVDLRQRYFTLDRGASRVVVIRIRDLDGDDARRLGQLRRGERVVVEVRLRDGGLAELVRFR
ncbi:MAG TPA: hypothetical protein VF158_06830 [Longimicrobiales bacterium]